MSLYEPMSPCAYEPMSLCAHEPMTPRQCLAALRFATGGSVLAMWYSRPLL